MYVYLPSCESSPDYPHVPVLQSMPFDGSTMPHGTMAMAMAMGMAMGIQWPCEDIAHGSVLIGIYIYFIYSYMYRCENNQHRNGQFIYCVYIYTHKRLRTQGNM